MSLKLAFEAFRVFIRTERLSVRAGTFLVHMAWVFFVAMLHTAARKISAQMGYHDYPF